jgi:hypothetical protein
MRRSAVFLSATTRVPDSSAGSAVWARPPRVHEIRGAAQRADHKRDSAYGRFRPLPELPWCCLSEKTFLDEAERKFGRKETWHSHPDPETRMQLVRVLKTFIDRCLRQANTHFKTAKQYERKVTTGAALFRARVHAGLSQPATLRSWAEEAAASDEPPLPVDVDPEPIPPMISKYAAPVLEKKRTSGERQQRGSQSELGGTVAETDEPFHAEYSAFPFLRQRAVEASSSLDASLVDWAAKHFPADTEETFAAPPLLRSDENGEADGAESALATAVGESRGVVRAASLSEPLASVVGAHNFVADQQGVYYKVRPFTGQEEATYGEAKLPRPRKARGGSTGPVRKVDWTTVELAKQSTKTAAVHRARERLARISRGEDPGGVQ